MGSNCDFCFLISLIFDPPNPQRSLSAYSKATSRPHSACPVQLHFLQRRLLFILIHWLFTGDCFSTITVYSQSLSTTRSRSANIRDYLQYGLAFNLSRDYNCDTTTIRRYHESRMFYIYCIDAFSFKWWLHFVVIIFVSFTSRVIIFFQSWTRRMRWLRICIIIIFFFIKICQRCADRSCFRLYGTNLVTKRGCRFSGR